MPDDQVTEELFLIRAAVDRGAVKLASVRSLLKAVEAVLKPHQRGPVVILGALCPRHENHRYFSITAVEAADVIACPECTATVRDSCAYCGPQVPWDACPVRTAVSRALLGEGETGA